MATHAPLHWIQNTTKGKIMNLRYFPGDNLVSHYTFLLSIIPGEVTLDEIKLPHNRPIPYSRRIIRPLSFRVRK